MNNELKSCPYCGSSDVSMEEFDDGFRVLCNTDGCINSAARTLYVNEKYAVAAWNKREYSWDLPMAILDEVYPPDVFNGSSGSVGSRIIMNLREIDLLRQEGGGE